MVNNIAFGNVDDEGNLVALSPDNATKKFFDTSADVEADFRILYIPAEDAIFEAQFDDSEDIVIGEGYDILATDGNSTTGRSQMEINGDAKTIQFSQFDHVAYSTSSHGGSVYFDGDGFFFDF